MGDEISKPGVATPEQLAANTAANAGADTGSNQIGNVKIESTGGGWYTLTSDLIVDGSERIQGKTAMEERVKELNAAGDGGNPGSPNFQTLSDEAQAQKDKDAHEAEINARAAELLAQRELEKEEAAKAPAPKAPMPTAFTGTLDAKTQKAIGGEFTDIILEESDDIPPTGLFLSHNFRGYQIVAGEKVTVPNFLIGVLDDAVTSAPVVDPGTKQVIGYRDRRRFNYTRV